MRSIITGLFLFVASISLAQNKLTPGEKSFESKWIRNTDYTMKWYALKDTTKFEIGSVLTQIETNKNSLTVTTQVIMKNAKMKWIDSTVADIKTLAPIYHSSYNGQRDMVLNFGKIVTGYYNDKIKNRSAIVSDTTTENYFDSNLYPLLIGWLPLKEGYKKDIAIYDYNPDGKIGVVKAAVRDVKTGTYPTEKSGTRKVWIVTVEDEIANESMIYYFDQENRKLWQQEINMGNRKMLMQLME